MTQTPYLYAYIWHCDDDVCDCYQPIIELVEDNPRYANCYLCERLWEGTFHSQPDKDEALEQIAELVFAASARGIVLKPGTWTGSRTITPQMATHLKTLNRSRAAENLIDNC